MANLTCFISKYLNTDDLDNVAKQDVTLRKYYIGTFPADVKPKILPSRCCWIWNVDEKTQPGSHWVAIIKDGKQIYFFDSYGKTPGFFKRQYWMDYFHKSGYRVTMYNKEQKQSYISRTCGVWCLVFLKMYWRGINIIGTFNAAQLVHNERRLNNVSFNLFSPLYSLYERKCIEAKGQICKTYMETFINK
jgi:hypothetical protein